MSLSMQPAIKKARGTLKKINSVIFVVLCYFCFDNTLKPSNPQNFISKFADMKIKP